MEFTVLVNVSNRYFNYCQWSCPGTWRKQSNTKKREQLKRRNYMIHVSLLDQWQHLDQHAFVFQLATLDKIHCTKAINLLNVSKTICMFCILSNQQKWQHVQYYKYCLPPQLTLVKARSSIAMSLVKLVPLTPSITTYKH